MTASEAFDVVVVGGGNAALSAALAASGEGASVLLLERAPEPERGGNSRFTSGSYRFAFDSVEDLRQLMPNLSDAELERLDFGTYGAGDFYDDMFRLTSYRTDPQLCEQLVTRSYPTMQWLASKGARFLPRLTHAFESGGRFKFSGGVVTELSGGGEGIIERYTELARKSGVAVRYGAHVLSLIHDGIAVKGVRVREGAQVREVDARSVVLACGGFEANLEWRARYLGPGWELVKVRGSRFNTGDGHRMALDIGAAAYGHWSGCHAVAWDSNAPEFGDLAVGSGYQKHSYPLGIIVNANGKRFVDEGADFRHFTYARYGPMILDQPGQFAWQVFDAKVSRLLRADYRIRQVTKVTADTLEELSRKLEGVDPAGFMAEVTAYNRGVMTDVPFDPAVKDGRGTVGLEIPKSNWANRLDHPPFEAYQVGCGITFTFGGLRIVPATAQVVDTDLEPIPGLFAAGEIVGGLFYFNYPGGAGLMAGAVFGRIAGTSAARAAKGGPA